MHILKPVHINDNRTCRNTSSGGPCVWLHYSGGRGGLGWSVDQSTDLSIDYLGVQGTSGSITQNTPPLFPTLSEPQGTQVQTPLMWPSSTPRGGGKSHETLCLACVCKAGKEGSMHIRCWGGG